MVQQNNMRPEIPAGIAQSPQFAAARSITQEGLPAAFKQLLEDEITFKAMELLDGSANEQAMGELPSPDSVRTQTREGLMSMLGSIGSGIQQQGSQMAQAQQQGPQMAMAQQSGGLPSQPTSNMAGQFASGGIVGFAKGGMPQGNKPKRRSYRPQSAIPVGNPNQPIPMLMQKYGTEMVTQFIAEQKALDAKARALAEAGPAAGSMQVEDHKLMKEIFSEKYRDILNESMGMAGGGIVGFQDGGRIKRFQGLEGSEVKESGGLHPFSFVNWLASKSLDAGALTGPQLEKLRDAYLKLGGDLGGAMDANMEQYRPANPMTEEEVAAARAQAGLDSGQAAPATSSFGEGLRGLLGQTDAKAATLSVPENDARPRRVSMQDVMTDPENNASVGALYPDNLRPASLREAGGEMWDALQAGASGREAGIASDPRPMSAEARATMNASYEKNAGIPSTLTGEDREAALREYYKDSRSGDSSTVDVPMFPEATYQMNKYADSDRFGSTVLRRMRENPEEAVSTLMMAMPLVGVGGTLGLGIVKSLVPYALKHPGLVSFLTGAAMKVPWEEIDLEGALSELGLGEDYEAVRDTLLTATLGEDPMRPSADTAASIIESGPTREEIKGNLNLSGEREQGFSLGDTTQTPVPYNPMKNVNAVADPNLRRAIEGTQAAPVATPVSETVEEVVVEGVNSGSIGSGGFQARLDAVIARQNDPLEAISTFLRAMGEGDTIGEGLQIAGKALDARRRSNDAEQIALLKLLEAGSINERDYKLKQEQLKLERQNVENQKERYEAQAANEKERTRITEVYYEALSGNNKQAADEALGQLRASYLEGIAIENDMMGALGYSQKQLDRLRENNYPEFDKARMEALGKYMQAVTGAAPAATSGLDPATQAVFNQYQ